MIKLLVIYFFINIIMAVMLYKRLKRPYSVSDIVAFVLALFFGTIVLIVSILKQTHERHIHNT